MAMTDRFILSRGVALRISESVLRTDENSLGVSENALGVGENSSGVGENPVAERAKELAQSEKMAGGEDRGEQGVAQSAVAVGKNLPVLLLLHGYLSSGDVFDSLAERLAPQFRIITLDLPGHGISEVVGEEHTMWWLADVVAGVLEACHVERATIVGHSMGGYVAMELLRAHPEMVERVVLMQSLPDVDGPEKIAERERELRIIAEGKRDMLARLVPTHSFAPENRRRMAEEMEAMSERISLMDDEGVAAIIRGLCSRRDNTDLLKDSPVPLMFIFSRHDERVDPERAAQLAATLPRAEVVWLEHSGHFGFLEEEEEVARRIIDFAR